MGLPWYRVHTVVLNDPGRLLSVHIMDRVNSSTNEWIVSTWKMERFVQVNLIELEFKGKKAWSLNNSLRTLFKRLRGTIRSNKPFWNKYSAACEPSGTVLFNVCSITLLPANAM